MNRRLQKLIEQKAWETLTEHGYNDSQLFEQLTQKVLVKLDEQKFSAKAPTAPVSPKPNPEGPFPDLPPGENPSDWPYPIGTGPNPSMLPSGGGKMVREFSPPIWRDNGDGQLYVWSMGPPPGWAPFGNTRTSQI